MHLIWPVLLASVLAFASAAGSLQFPAHPAMILERSILPVGEGIRGSDVEKFVPGALHDPPMGDAWSPSRYRYGVASPVCHVEHNGGQVLTALDEPGVQNVQLHGAIYAQQHGPRNASAALPESLSLTGEGRTNV